MKRYQRKDDCIQGCKCTARNNDARRCGARHTNVRVRAVRNRRGNVLVMIVCALAVILIPLLVLLTWGPQLIYGERAKNVVDAACLLAANDLSRIVIDDPTFGYVSLSNYPPIGKATRARDGEPLPVTGVNTLIGTVRTNTIIAEQLNNETMKSLATADYEALQSTLDELNAQLTEALGDRTRKGQCFDIDGKPVKPLEHVEAYLKDKLPSNVELESVRLTLGWLDGGSETTIDVPQPAHLSHVQEKDIVEGKYKSFTDYPIDEKTFSFAGLGTRSHQVAASTFQDDDGKHVSSVVRIECTIVSKDESRTATQYVACCQPFTQPDLSTRGAMTVRFSGRPVPGLLSWRDFLTTRYFQDNCITKYDIRGGDYPFERQARMREAGHEDGCGTAQQFSEHLYNWLRNARGRPRIDAVVAMVNEPFRYVANEVYTYEFANDGTIVRNVMDGTRFPRSVIADGQYVTMADTKVHTGQSAIIFFRDNVSRLGTDDGQHAGQPLAGYPLTRLEGILDYRVLAANFSKRNELRNGLALDIEIGGTADSTAAADVTSMSRRTAGRKI